MSTGSAQQTSTTTAGVSPFAQNYVDAMLGAGQQQVFNTQVNPTTGKMDITGIKPYVPFGAPMNAQGNVVPYGGQPQGMGWGTYGGGYGGGYGQQQQPAPAYTPPSDQNFMGMFDRLRNIGSTPQQPYTPVQQQNYGDFGFDQNVTDYLNKQRQASAYDAGVSYEYDPATKTFKGYTMAGPVTKTLDEIKQEADIINPANVPPPPGGVAVDPNDRQRTADGNYFFSSGQWWPNETVSAMGSLPGNYEAGSSRAQQYPQYQQPSTGYPTGTMQAGMGPGEQIAARSAVAGPSGLQQQAYRTAAGMQVPGQYGTATDIGQTAGLGLLNTAGQAQGLMSLAQQAVQQGRQYGQDITNPALTQQFMSPYMQNVVNAQQREALRQSGILGTQQAGQAVKSGAFGGSRAGLLEAERQRNLATQLGDIQATGLQSAFQNAQQQQMNAQQQAMQGLTSGMQGYGQGIQGQTGAYGQAMQGAGTLSNIGGQQLGSQQSIANLQNQFGQQQQQNQQQVINQAMQNYLMQKQYPQQQLQWLSSMLSGLPVSSTGQVTNIPAPSLVSQLGGLGLAGAGAYGLYRNLVPGGNKGGKVKSNPAGGIASIGLHKALKK